MASYENLIKAIREGDADLVESEVKKELSQGIDPQNILADGLIGGMGIVGKLMRDGDMFLPEVIASANAMHKGLDIVKRQLAESGQRELVLGKVVIGTVEGDIHDIGKRVVSFMLEGNGFEVIDIGIDVKPAAFAEAVARHNPDILGMSALLTTTMPQMEKVISLLKEKGLRGRVKIMVGGGSLNEDFARTIGADGYAPEAGSAVDLARKLLAK